jgi:hypothetical protein
MAKKAYVPLLTGAGYALFGWLTLSRQYTYDAISYLYDIEHTRLGLPLDTEQVAYNFFHSQHLLFSLFPWLWYHLWGLFGYTGSALLPAQMLNLMEGSLVLGLLCSLIIRLTGDRLLALFLCVFLGFTYTFWSNAAMVSDHMPSCLVGLIYFRVLLGTVCAEAPRGRLVLLGFLNGFGMLLHQVNGLFGVMFLTALFWEKKPWRASLRALTLYTVAAVATVAIPYYVVGVWVLGNTELHDFVYWCFYYAMPGVIDVAGRYGTVNFGKFAELLKGLGSSLIGGFYWMNRIFETRWWPLYGVPVLSAFGALLAAVLTFLSRRREVPDSQERKAARLGAAWFIGFAVLLFWWGPWYYQLWSVPLLGGFLYVAMWCGRGGSIAERPALLYGLPVLVFTVFAANATAAFIPSHDIANNDYYVTTMAIGSATSPADLIVVPGNDEYDTYLPYFAKRTVVSFHALLVDHENDAAASLAEVGERMEECWDRGGRVYIAAELRDGVKVYADLYELHHLTDRDVTPFFREFPVLRHLKTGELPLEEVGR